LKVNQIASIVKERLGEIKMNSHFKRWIHEAIESMPSEFSSHMILADIISKHGTSPYIVSGKSIGWYLSKSDKIIKIREADGRNVYMVKK
tara:strand:- start:7464 stop:7733 length:270 start_codon:yes stop_codon:yes gene_type:complete